MGISILKFKISVLYDKKKYLYFKYRYLLFKYRLLYFNYIDISILNTYINIFWHTIVFYVCELSFDVDICVRYTDI